jgi:hypothetical protein
MRRLAHALVLLWAWSCWGWVAYSRQWGWLIVSIVPYVTWCVFDRSKA